MVFKTDWTPDDYFNAGAELTRIECNIHEVFLLILAAGYSPTLSEKLTWTRLDFPTAGQFNRVANNITALQVAMRVNTLPEVPWFDSYTDAGQINNLESCIQRTYWTAAHTPPVQESGGKLLADSAAAVILCVATGFQAAYPSAYTGQQIEAFVERMKEWNDGQL